MNVKELIFPNGFLWGTATSAHQIEGGNTNNQWWEFEQTPGHILNNDSSKIACDHWNRYEKDFDLIKKINNNAYRMSIEWSRIYPEKHQLNYEALEHYHKMIDALIERNITPFVTLLHFTWPIWWNKEGNLLNQRKEHLDHFREFCTTLAKEFKGKIKFWNTINEPNIVAMAGFLLGEFPPHKRSIFTLARAIDTQVKMHAIAYHTIKQIDPSSQIGIVKNIGVVRPLRTRNFFDKLLAKITDYVYTGSTLRALKYGKLFWHILRKDRSLMNTNDFIGLNFYNYVVVSTKIKGLFTTQLPSADPDYVCDNLEWEAFPEGILINLERLHKEFNGLPIYITENGIGTTKDEIRQRLLVDHLKMANKAIAEGINLKGYFHWSLIDNFEWNQGYSSRFGLYFTDFETQERKIKKSGELYSTIAKSNRITEDILKKFPVEIYKPDFSY